MKHFPIFVSTENRTVIVSGGGDAALAKLRLLLKTEAKIHVFTRHPASEISQWADTGLLTLHKRDLAAKDLTGATLFYAANENARIDACTSAMAKAQGVLTNIVDNLDDSQFITPAIVDRDPVTVAIGTEGAAPVLARAIKASVEEQLPPQLGVLAQLGKTFRKAAKVLPMGRKRRAFWSDFYFRSGPLALSNGRDADANAPLEDLLEQHLHQDDQPGHVAFVGAGPGDPELLTLKARKALDNADVVIYDRLVSTGILELARREAIMIDAGKKGFGPSTSQEQINRLMVDHAATGAHVVRLKGGDPTIFGRLDEEIEAVEAACIPWHVVPGITASSASVAAIGQSLTKRGRNSSARLLTGHDTKGFADHDWHTLTRSGQTAAIYMGKKSARFIQGRLLMHGAAPLTPVTVIENVSCADQRVIATTLADLPDELTKAQISGPALMLYGLAPRHSQIDEVNLYHKEFA